MSLNQEYNSNQLRDYSSLFSRGSVLEWMRGDLSSIDYKINRYDQSWLKNRRNRYIDYLKHVYNILENHYQNEYILKNSFLNDWLINEVGESNSQIFSEFRIGKAIADLAMFNGTSKVFEIKTDLDSDKRLNSQLQQYKKVFNEIYLIVPSAKYDLYQGYDKGIGVITFDNVHTQRFKLVRPAKVNYDLDNGALMQIFHSSEYKKVVENYHGFLPNMTSFNQFEVCSEKINEIPREELNRLFIQLMKLRGVNAKLSRRYYKEFNQLSLALKMNNEYRKQLFSVLKSPLND